MPTSLYLDEFAAQACRAFPGDGNFRCYLVGSALRGKLWRDVDVRMILSDALYESEGLGDPRDPHTNARWRSLVMAYSALGRHMTGLPIDFQIQQQTWANERYPSKDGHGRSAIGLLPYMFVPEPPKGETT